MAATAERSKSSRIRVPARIWNPPGHWKLFAFCLLAMLAIIAFQGFATHTIGATSEPHATTGQAAPLVGKRPVFAASGSALVSVQPPAGRRIALTFDDGPDPRWTKRIAAELHTAGVRATFFVIGSQAARYPDLVRTLVRDGDELGNHTFTHVLLSAAPGWERRMQIDMTEATLAGITGHYTRLIRPPYSATPDAVTLGQERDLAQLAGRHYYIVLANYDSKDWQRPGVGAILRNATPRGTTGGIVMLHDGGGDRSQTVAAVRKLIPELRARGFRFVTVSQLAGIRMGVAEPVAAGWSNSRGSIFVLSVRIAYALTTVISIVLILIAVLVGLRALLLFALASHHVRLTRSRSAANHVPSVAIVVPAYNEEVGIERAVRSLAASEYEDFEIVVVDDGSTDRTAEIVAALELECVRLVRQDNAGKAAALNTGIELTDSEIIVMVDGDTLFEPETLGRLMRPFADEGVAAVSATRRSATGAGCSDAGSTSST